MGEFNGQTVPNLCDSSYAPNFMDKIRRMRWLKCQGIKMGNPPCNIWHLMRSMWRIGIKWPCLSPKLMHAYSNRALKNCTSTTMAPACGINRSVLRLMLVISDIDVRLGKREKCLGVHLEDYLFSSLPNASIVSDSPRPLATTIIPRTDWEALWIIAIVVTIIVFSLSLKG